LYSQSISKSSIDSGGAVAQAGDIQIMYTIGEVNVQELSAGNIQVSEGFVNKAPEVEIAPMVFLQGPFLNPSTPGLMNDDLRVLGVLPTTSPYEDGATVAASVFNVTGNDAIVDWVQVALRSASDPINLINKKSALLQRDGDIVGLDGVSNLLMTAPPTDYYIIVKHRNHIGSMTSITIGLNKNTATIVDFKSNALATFGSNARVDMGSGNFALWAGNAGGDIAVRYLGSGSDANRIKDEVIAHINNTTSSNLYSFTGYNIADINLDGTIRYQGSGNDTNILKDIVLSHPDNQSSPSNLFTIQEQLPEN